jgi:hypothetical protein
MSKIVDKEPILRYAEGNDIVGNIIIKDKGEKVL